MQLLDYDSIQGGWLQLIEDIEKITWATLAWRSGVRWSSRVIMTGYGDAEKACSLMDSKHFIISTGVVRVLHL